MVCVGLRVSTSAWNEFLLSINVLLRLLVRWSWSTVSPCQSFTNGFVSQGSKNLAKSIWWYMPFCPDKKNSRTIFLVRFVNVLVFCLYYFLSLRPLNCCPSNLCPYFCLIVLQGHCTYFRNILQLLRNTRALIITTCLIKLIKL